MVLVFCGDGGTTEMNYQLEDLLKASAETLGRGTMGSTYKAVMETGLIVTVKRLKDATWPNLNEFCRHVDMIGKLRQKNLVPLRAYFQSRGERLLVFDYFPNGSLFSLIHDFFVIMDLLVNWEMPGVVPTSILANLWL
ncbi:inactive leucine-rich repeat receptor-like serine/threonine-protein kinase At1g60630 [Rutidosis leptorrhynchoides]|uniref:inactive leucine-rich repeat receptor-like serine/threonine-protein kinase At1g60630 n=1 Tax=Rutidosis leptorrhynchoides TaxID=125765 RepID=UPI003A98D809